MLEFSTNSKCQMIIPAFLPDYVFFLSMDLCINQSLWIGLDVFIHFSFYIYKPIQINKYINYLNVFHKLITP